MDNLTREMIEYFGIKELGYDFMGYYKQKGDDYTFHHTITPKRDNGAKTFENGSILFTTPHNYLHTIENFEIVAFEYITRELIIMNYKGYLDEANIRRIHDALSFF